MKTRIKEINIRNFRIFGKYFNTGILGFLLVFMLISCVPRTSSGIGNGGAAATAPSVQASESKVKDFLKTFDYDPALPLNVEEKVLKTTGSYVQYHLLYDSVNGEKVPALFYLPVKKAASYPCLIVQHGYGMDKNFGEFFAGPFIPKGYAIIAIDIEYHGERKEEGKDVLSTDVADDSRALHQTVVDLKRTVDYLKARGDIDMTKIGYVGVSLGSFLGSVFSGIDSRIASTVLIVGGGDWEKMIATSKVPPFDGLRKFYKDSNLPYSDYEEKMSVVEPVNFISMIAPRELLMLNCSDDIYVPKTNAEELFAAAKDPKEIKWFTCGGPVGHIPPMDKVSYLLKGWFKKTLGK